MKRTFLWMLILCLTISGCSLFSPPEDPAKVQKEIIRYLENKYGQEFVVVREVRYNFELGKFLAQGKLANATSNLGEILMSGAVIASASGFGAPVAAGMAAIGGGLWLIGKAIEHRKTIAKVFTQPVQTAKEVANTVTKAAKNVATTVKKGISNAVDTVKGWFS